MNSKQTNFALFMVVVALLAGTGILTDSQSRGALLVLEKRNRVTLLAALKIATLKGGWIRVSAGNVS